MEFAPLFKDRFNSAQKLTLLVPVDGGQAIKPITGYLSDNFSFTTSSDFSGAQALSGGGLTKILNSLQESVQTLFAKQIEGNTVMQDILGNKSTSLFSMISKWTGSKPISFTVPIIRIALDETDNVLNDMVFLHGCALPYETTSIVKNENRAGWNVFGSVSPAMKYDTTEATCCSLSIGRWFNSKPVFNIVNVQSQVSKEMMPNGNPIYAIITVTLSAYRVIDSKEWAEFFPTFDGSGYEASNGNESASAGS